MTKSPKQHQNNTHEAPLAIIFLEDFCGIPTKRNCITRLYLGRHRASKMRTVYRASGLYTSKLSDMDKQPKTSELLKLKETEEMWAW